MTRPVVPGSPADALTKILAAARLRMAREEAARAAADRRSA